MISQEITQILLKHYFSWHFNLVFYLLYVTYCC